jgi:dienelactone hydrolase
MTPMPPDPICSRRSFLHHAGTVAAAGILSRPASGADRPEVPTTLDTVRREVERAPLALKFRGETAADAHKWQAVFGDKLRQLLGPHRPPKTWKVAVRQAKDLDGHRREDLVLTADGQPPLPVYLLLPRPKGSGRVPGVVAVHGHGEHGHHPVAGRDDLPGVARAIASANYDYGRQLARRGYAVAVPCLTPFGERLGDKAAFGKQDPCADTFLRLQMLGKLLIAENLRACLWALELLAGRAEVDAARLGCVGLSYGGRMTTLTAAVEPRVRVAVISGALNLMQERVSQPYSCGAQIIPGLLNFGDIPEIAALIAPRHCLWEVGARDGLIKREQAEEALARMRSVYQALGAADRLRVDRFDGGHVWHGTAAYALLDQVFK